MADSKITALTSIGTITDPAVDPLVIVDVSDTSMAASGTTKRVTLNNLLACSPTATLASATITGDLTVDTNTLKVDSTLNRVGIGTASPTAALDVFGAFGTATAAAVLRNNSAFNNSNIVETQFFATNSNTGLDCIAKFGALNQTATGNNYGTFYWQIANAGSPTEAMRLNSTGLGVGMSPQYKLQVGSTTYSSIGLNIASVTDTACIFKGTPDAVGYEFAKVFSGRDTSAYTYGSYLAFYTEGKNSGTTDTSIERLRIDSTGNVGIGVTPSAWSGYGAPVIQMPSGGTFVSAGSIAVASNFWYSGGQFKYIANSTASYYFQNSGQHIWYTAPSGFAGNNITGANAFVQMMTLDASGNLLLGTSAVAGRLQVAGSAAGSGVFSVDSDTTRVDIQSYNKPLALNRAGNNITMCENGGNVGVGVTPSAGKGCLQLSSGINFPATQVASSDANTLDDYEEGTWTPTIIGTTTSGTGTYSLQAGQYTKIGNRVFVEGYIGWTAHTGTGNMRIAGLPFTINSSSFYSSGSIGDTSGIALTAGNILAIVGVATSATIDFKQLPTGGGSSAAVPIDTSANISFSFCYLV